MGRLVNVVLPGGRVVAVPEEDANEGTFAKETTAQEAARASARVRSEEQGGLANQVLTAGEGLADAATGGLYGLAATNLLGDETARNYRARAQENPGSRLIGELGSFAVPGGLPNLAAHAGEAVTARVAAGAVNPLTRGATSAANAAGRAVEGAIVGAGGHVASTNVTGDPLTIESTLLSVGTGAVLNVGMGAVADRVRSIGTRAEGVTSEAATRRADVDLLKEGRDVFSKPRDSWESFKESIKSTSADEAKATVVERKASEQWSKWVGSNQKVEGALRQAEKARNELQTRISQTKYGKAVTETGEAFGEASAQVGKLKDKASKLTGSTEDWPATMKSVDDAINQVRGRYAPKGADEPLYKPKLEGYTGSFDERGAFDRGDSFYSARTKKMPISEKLDAELTEFSQRASRIRQMKQGGYKMKGNKWVADADAPANPEGALQELRKLREDFSKRFGGVEFPDLPELPSSVKAPLKATRENWVSEGKDPFDDLPGKTYHHYSERPEAPEVPIGRANEFAGGSGPRGVYTWPEDAEVVTFGKNRPHKFDLKAKNKVLDTGEYTSEDLERDLKVLGKEGLDIDKTRQMWQKYKGNFKSADKPFAELWYAVTKGYKKGKVIDAEEFGGWSSPGVTNAEEATQLMRKLGHNAVEDKHGIFYSSEPHQAAFFDNDAFVVRQPSGGSVNPQAFDVVERATNKDIGNLQNLMGASRELTDGIATARKLFRAGDREGAAEELRMLQERVAAYGQNDLVLPTVPMKADVPVELPKVRIPETLHDLARMEQPTIERLSNLMAKDPNGRIAGEFQKLAKELDVDPVDGIAGLHAKLGKYIGANDRLVAIARKEAEDEASGGLLSVLRNGAKKFVRYGSARAADAAAGGGWLGAAARVGAGEGSSALMNTTEDLISGSMMSGRLGVKEFVSKIIAKGAKPTARAFDELGPISSYLKSSWLTGKEDDDHDEGALAVKRIAELTQTAQTAPDATFLAVQSLLGHVSDVGFKMHQKIVGDIQHLMEVAPKDPGISMNWLKSDWTPPFDEAMKFAYRIEAVVNPLKAIARTIAGDGHPAAVETLWLRWPALMQTAAEETAYTMHDIGDGDMTAAANFSTLFRTPITGLMAPTVALALQGMHLPQPEQQAPQSQSTGRPVGRPAAVQSSIAGSSVSGLLA